MKNHAFSESLFYIIVPEAKKNSHIIIAIVIEKIFEENNVYVGFY